MRTQSEEDSTSSGYVKRLDDSQTDDDEIFPWKALERPRNKSDAMMVKRVPSGLTPTGAGAPVIFKLANGEAKPYKIKEEEEEAKEISDEEQAQ